MKQIAHLFQSLLPNRNSAFTTKIGQSTLLQNNTTISMSDILYLIECFEGYGPECNGIYLAGQEYMVQFFEVLNERPLSTLAGLKITLTLHLILYEFQVGELLAENLVDKGNKIQVLDKNLHSDFVRNYKMYLLKLSQSLKIFYAAKVGQYPPMEQDEMDKQIKNQQDTENIFESQAQNFKKMREVGHFGVNNMHFQEYQQQQLEKQLLINSGFISHEQKCLILFKLHNLLRCGIQLLENCLNILAMLKGCDINQVKNLYIEASCVLWNDIMVIYKFCGTEINKLLDSFRSYNQSQLIQTQSIYFSTIDLTSQIKKLYQRRQLFDIQKIVRKPIWYEDNKQLSKELLNAIIDKKVSYKLDSNRIQTVLQSPAGQKSPINLQIHPFSARNNQNDKNQKPYFQANSKKTPLSHQVSPPDSRRHQYMKQFIGSIFDEECLSGRGQIQNGQVVDKEQSTQASRIRR